jgi:prepilin-type N-terminal cleavage/methylation domain-containing protein
MKLSLPHFVGRKGKRAFTLVELIVSISVLALMVGILGQMFNGTAALISFRNKSMDVDAEARALLDRMAVDFGGMVKRSDVNYYLKSDDPEATYPQDSVVEIPPGTSAANPMTGNDQMAFYSEVSGFYLTSGAAQSTLSLVGYRLNTTTYQMERYGRGLYWNGTAAAASSDQPVFLPIPLGVQWPAVISATATDADYQSVGPPVFRFEYYYLLKSGALSTTPWDKSAVPQHTSLNGLKDVAAIAVTLAAIDSKSRNIVSNATLANLAGQMNDFSSAMAPGALESQWEGVFQTANLPSSKLSALHVYHRYFYLNTK